MSRISRGAAAVVGASARRSAFSTSASAHARVGFLGLGNMGLPMAHCLRRAGHDLIVFDSERGDAGERARPPG